MEDVVTWPYAQSASLVLCSMISSTAVGMTVHPNLSEWPYAPKVSLVLCSMIYCPVSTCIYSIQEIQTSQSYL